MIFVFFLFFSISLAQNSELVDGVLAVVENKHILFSEVLGESRVAAEQKNINPQTSPLLFQSVFEQILKDKINLHVVLAAAEKDSLIDVSYDEISRSLDERISLFSSQLGSTEKLEEAFGLSLVDIKNNYWETVREEIVIEKFRYSLLGDVAVSQKDVLLFYEDYKDSIPAAPPSASFSLLHKKIETSNKTIESIVDKLSAIKDSVISKDLSFESFVVKYSEDPSVSINKGVMTTVRGDLVPEYEKIAYSLNRNQISDPVKTSFGYHLIKLIDRVGEKITTQHLLLFVRAGEKEKINTISYLDSILTVVENDPGLFDSLSVISKKNPLNFSGFYDKVEISSFPEAVVEKIKSTKNYYFSTVFGDNENQYLLYKYDFNPSVKINLNDNWFYLEQMAINKKRSDVFNLWIDKQLEKTYVKVNKNY
tara:strand:- start:218 stop:1486 length:1269 start_codon:yes stop_codon:yes gene_type:complete